MANTDAETLYGLPLDEFTAARDEVAKAHRKAGRTEDAERVAALRKPVLSAWVVNRLARDERKEMQRLVDSAEAIRSGGDGAERAFREALERLTSSARSLLVAEGRAPDPTLQQVSATLRAGAASDPEALLAGALTQPLEATGFGPMAGATPASARSRRSRSETRPRIDRRAVERARRAVAEARDEVRRLDRAANAAEREARKAREAAEAARARLSDAEERLAEARGR